MLGSYIVMCLSAYVRKCLGEVGSAEKLAICDCLVFRTRPNVPTFGTVVASSKKFIFSGLAKGSWQGLRAKSLRINYPDSYREQINQSTNIQFDELTN